MNSMEEIFSDLAYRHIPGGKDKYPLICEFKKMYESGRASMLIELELKKSFGEVFKTNNPEQFRESIKKIMMEKLEDFRDRGIIAPVWEPRFHVEKSKEDPNRIDIIPDDEETARWFQDMQRPGNY